ncbi:MAG: tetratricopeptide repeat protein [Kiritimatiellaeota bacterium]|nr:tetratricopeptide repeat protein [Kiritimatiellota bacterium]
MAVENEQELGPVKGGRWFAVLALLTLALFGVRTISHSDFWMTLVSGRWIAAHGIPHTDPFSLLKHDAAWVDPAWLYDLMVYQLWSAGGAALVTLVSIAAVVVAFLLLIRTARPLGGFIVIAVALLVAAWLLAPAFMVRSRVFTLIFPAVFICCLTRGCGRWGAWLLLLPAEALWVNMHHTFRLGPVICLIFALQNFPHWRSTQGNVASGDTVTEGGRAAWLQPLLLAGGTLMVTLANPYGLGMWSAVNNGGFGSGNFLMAEQVSVFSYLFGGSDTNHLIWTAAAVNLMGLVAEKHRLPLGITLLALLGTGLAIMSPYYATIMAVFSFPFFVLSIRAVGLFLWDVFADVVQRRHVLFRRVLVAGLLLATAVSICRLVSNHYYYSCGSGSSFGFGVNEEALPAAAAVQVIGREQFPLALVNNALDGGNLLWHLPRRQVFLDARAQFQGLALSQLAARGFAGDPQAWQTIESRLRPTAVLINCCQPQTVIGMRNIIATGHWGLLYFDGTSALLLLNTPANRALLDDAQLRSLGPTNLELARRAYERRVAAHWFPAHSPALIGAGHALLALNQFAEAEKIYVALVHGAPNMVGAWLELGICRCRQGHWQEALPALRRATAGASKNVIAWLWYGQACQRLGLEQEAKEARQRAQKLNPVVTASFENDLQLTLSSNTPPVRLKK